VCCDKHLPTESGEESVIIKLPQEQSSVGAGIEADVVTAFVTMVGLVTGFVTMVGLVTGFVTMVGLVTAFVTMVGLVTAFVTMVGLVTAVVPTVVAATANIFMPAVDGIGIGVVVGVGVEFIIENILISGFTFEVGGFTENVGS